MLRIETEFWEDVSLPSRERGLKFRTCRPDSARRVAPLAGAWIEMPSVLDAHLPDVVAPLAGAWIEISATGDYGASSASRSPRGSVD